jgi:hypothetical protein
VTNDEVTRIFNRMSFCSNQSYLKVRVQRLQIVDLMKHIWVICIEQCRCWKNTVPLFNCFRSRKSKSTDDKNADQRKQKTKNYYEYPVHIIRSSYIRHSPLFPAVMSFMNLASNLLGYFGRLSSACLQIMFAINLSVLEYCTMMFWLDHSQPNQKWSHKPS